MVGAGGAGLMCAHQLLTKGVVDLEDILILEARDRVGGRIHTTVEAVTPIISGKDSSNNNNAPVPVSMYRDHGAAWVHGTGFDWPNYSSSSPEQKTVENGDGNNKSDNDKEEEEGAAANPMMELLLQTTPKGENVCLTHLEPTFPLGNPWMRPGHVCIGPNQLVLFVNGVQIGGSGDEDNAAKKTNMDDTTIIFSQALKEHTAILNQVGRIGYDLIVNGQTQVTVEQSFQKALDQVLLAESDSSDGHKSSLSNIANLVPLVAGFYRHLIECWHGTSASGLQLHEFSAHVQGDDNINNETEDYLLDEPYTDEGDFYGPHCTMKKGMQAVLEPLLETASPCIRLNEPVSRIRLQASHDTQGDMIGIEMSSGTMVEADYCVITVPLGCLAESLRSPMNTESHQSEGTIRFEPNLSADKVQAIQHMDMGCYKKVFLTFDRIFWPIKEAFLGLVRSKPRTSLDNTADDDDDDGIGNHLLLDNLWACKGLPCIEAVLIGNAGTWGTGKSDEVICNAVLQFLADAMDLDYSAQLKQWCVDCHITRWEEDPYSRGAYSGYRLGTTELHTKGLATSEWGGRLVFAGEATLSGYEGSVHAALISGENAAKEIESKLPCSNAVSV